MATEGIPFARADAAQYTQLPAVPANRYVAELHIQLLAGNYATIHVIDWAFKSVLHTLYPPPPQTSVSESWRLTSGDCADGLDPTQFGVLFDHANDGWNAYAVVR